MRRANAGQRQDVVQPLQRVLDHGQGGREVDGVLQIHGEPQLVDVATSPMKLQEAAQVLLHAGGGRRCVGAMRGGDGQRIERGPMRQKDQVKSETDAVTRVKVGAAIAGKTSR